jgi:photosystem II stability/assembly factor-like uncharacterized protein
VLYVASQYGYGGAVSRSADGGTSWRRVFETENILDVSLEALAVDPTHPGTVYAGTGWPSRHASEEAWGVFVSHDSGRTWSRSVAGLSDRDTRPGINALAVSPKTGDAYAATSVGVLLPYALADLGRDPAFGSGPLAMVIRDLVSILAYFAVASALV